MRFVALKTEAQLDVQLLHRVRDRLVGQRTSLINQMRSILLERGIVVAQARPPSIKVVQKMRRRSLKRINGSDMAHTKRIEFAG